MTSRPWMPLYIGDYRRDTAHLNATEHGAYLLLIMHYWETGPLPAEPDKLARIAAVDPRTWHRVWKTIEPFFKFAAAKGTQTTECSEANAKQLLGNCWVHKRIDAELEKTKSISEKRAYAGRKGGRSSRGLSNMSRHVNQAIAKQTGIQSQSHKDYLLTSQSVAAPQQGASEGVSRATAADLKPSPELSAIVASMAKRRSC